MVTRIRINTKPGMDYSTVVVLDYDERIREYVRAHEWYWNPGNPKSFQVRGCWAMDEPRTLERSFDDLSGRLDGEREKLTRYEALLARCEQEGDTEGIELMAETTRKQLEWVKGLEEQLRDLETRLKAVKDNGYTALSFDTDEKFQSLREVVGWMLDKGMEVKARQERTDKWIVVDVPSDIDVLQKRKA